MAPKETNTTQRPQSSNRSIPADAVQRPSEPPFHTIRPLPAGTRPTEFLHPPLLRHTNKNLSEYTISCNADSASKFAFALSKCTTCRHHTDKPRRPQYAVSLQSLTHYVSHYISYSGFPWTTSILNFECLCVLPVIIADIAPCLTCSTCALYDSH